MNFKNLNIKSIPIHDNIIIMDSIPDNPDPVDPGPSYGEISSYVAKNYPNDFDSDLYDWKNYSWAVAMFCPQRFETDRYNWELDSWAISKYCPQHFDPDRYNWTEHSWHIAQYCLERFDPEKYNWCDENAIDAIRERAPHLLLKYLSIP